MNSLCFKHQNSESFIVIFEDNYVMDLSEVVVFDSIPVAPSHIPGSSNLQKHSHLRDISLPVIELGTVTLLIGNDFATAHRCLDNRFSPEPDKSLDAMPLGGL